MGFIVAGIVGLASIIAPTAIAGAIGAIGITVSAATITAIGVSLALSAVSQLLLTPKVPESQLSRLNVSLDTTTPRKAVFGTTALNLDLRYHEASGADQEYIDYIISVAAHKVKSIDEIWFEEKKAWTASGGVTSTYANYLWVETLTEASASSYLTVNAGTKWGASQRMTGCALVKIRIRRSGIDKEVESPLVNALPSRVTIIGEGAPLYDPRKDSTVAGGSGTHRTNNQATWGVYTNPDDTDNPALQLLWWLLGWKINDKLSIGCGVPADRIDLQSFIVAANICDENVTLASGGTQKRYRTSGTASDSDDRMNVISTFLACMNGTLRDSNGKLALTIIKNDLSNYVMTLDDNDMLDDFEWSQTRGLTESYSKVRGSYVDPSQNSLYQLVDYPEIEVAGGSPDGIERVMTLDLPYVEDGRRAQRIAKQVLQRNQYRGTFSASFTAKALGCDIGDVVRLTFTPLGWSNKLFRVVSKEVRFDGQVPLVLIEENAAIYAWDAEDVAPVTPNAPTVYDPLKSPIIKGITEANELTITGYLTNEAITIAADSLGNVISYSGAVGDFKVYQGITDKSSLATYSVASTVDATVSINATTGAYSVSNLAAENGSATLQAVFGGVTLQKVLSLSKARQGNIGNIGPAGLNAYLTKESVQVFAYANGGVVSYAPTAGEFKVFSGNTDISSNFSLSTVDNPQSLIVVYSGRNYQVTGGFDAAEDNATVTIRATGSGDYVGVTLDKVMSLSKSKGGYEIVDTLPTTELFEGRVVYLKTDDKLYRYNGTAWTKAVDGLDLVANSVTTNAIDAGAVTAAKINVTSLSAITATIGTLRTATSGARTEIKDNLIEVYDAANVKRVQIGVW